MTCGIIGTLKLEKIWCSISSTVCIDSARNISQPRQTRLNVKKTPAARNDKQLPDIDFDRFKTSRSFAASRKRKDVFMKSLICLAFIIACIPLISVLWTTVANGIKRLNLNFLSYNMSGVVGGSQTPSGGYGGVLHAIIGTLEITLGAMVISVPVGLMLSLIHI